MRELLRSNAFREYRKKQIEAICDVVSLFTMKDANDCVHLIGALEMARVLIRLPEKLVEDKHKPGMQALVVEDLKVVEQSIIRKHLTGGKK